MRQDVGSFTIEVARLLLVAAVIAWNSSSVAAQTLSSSKQNEQLLSLLTARDYDQIDLLLEEAVKEYNRDFRLERKVELAFDTFFRAGPELEPLLSEWITKRPNSSSAHLARGVYYAKLGWTRRGTRYATETAEQQFAGMTANFRKAQVDLDHALALNDQFLPAICYKIEILMALGGSQDEIRSLRDRALKSNPYSLSARWYYITTLLPRWGGSMREVEGEIAAARPYYQKNPALRVLEGRIAAENGDQALFAGDYAKAVELYGEALKHGPNWFYYKQRGEAYTRMGQFDLSDQDLRLALQLRPNYPRALYILGFNQYRKAFVPQVKDAQKFLVDAVGYLDKMLEAEPDYHMALDIRGDAHFLLQQHKLALADFERALALDPTNEKYRQDVNKAKAALAGAKNR